MIRVKVPETSNSEIQVTLGGKLYTFYYKYNKTTARWYLDIYFNSVPVILSLKLVEDTGLLTKVSKQIISGQMYVVKFKETSEPCGRDNLGIGKAYELVYLLPEE